MSTELSSNGYTSASKGEFIDMLLVPLPKINLDVDIKNDNSLPITLFSAAELESKAQLTEITSIPEKDSFSGLGWSSAVMSRRRQRNLARFRRR